jgi:membrane fusion protein (multidrug efflux system)
MAAATAPEASPANATPAARGTALSTPAPTGGSKKKFVLAIVGLVAIVGIVYGVKSWTYSRAHESTDNAQIDGHIVPVIAKVGGYVNTVRAEENMPVKEGQLLVQIDDAEYRVRLAQALADVAAARATTSGGGANVGQARAQVQTISSQTAAGEAQVLAARANLERAENDLRRYEDLAAKQIVSQQALDAMRATAASARANLVAVQRQTSATGAGVTGAEAGVQSAQANVRLAEARSGSAAAARDNASLQLSYTKITAPTSGVISRKSVEIGQLVQPGQTLMSIVADTGVWVTANLKETQLRDVRVGQHAQIDIDAYDGAKVEGTVESIASATGAKFALLPPDNATGNFTKVVQRVPVRIHITKGLGANRPLRPGMSANVHIDTQ